MSETPETPESPPAEVTVPDPVPDEGTADPESEGE